ncbi:MAG TPA: phosphate acyltransferase PlsX [Alphaproteobacteria bacterium]|nr:phosphate acyltransferase PlsX [Alphaproteobacteria bacterium]
MTSSGLRAKGKSNLAASITVALDAMGGDHAPEMVVAGADLARARYPNVKYILFGDQARIEPLLGQFKALQPLVTIRHTDEAIANDAKPSAALRSGRNSSMRLAIDAVASGEAGCVVSAGNTGALMAMAKLVLKTLPGIHRPAIASFIPTAIGESVMLDLGANIECDADNLVQFAIMGAIFARTVLGIPEPTIGLLNVGAEQLKGNDVVKEAAEALRSQPVPGRFHGFIEGNDIPGGAVDVVVTDGFTGNIALKLAEGMGKLYSGFLQQSFRSSIMATLGYLMARSAFAKLRERVDPRRYNGGMFLGLSGVCVKSHGGIDAFGFSNAIGVAVDMVVQGFNERISEELERLAPAPAPEPVPVV